MTSYQAGTALTVTFTVDTETGGFTGFDGVAALGEFVHDDICGRLESAAPNDPRGLEVAEPLGQHVGTDPVQICA